MYPQYLMIDTGAVNYVYSAYGSPVIQLAGPADVLMLRIQPAINYTGSGTIARATHIYAFPQCTLEDYQLTGMFNQIATQDVIVALGFGLCFCLGLIFGARQL